MIFGKLFGRHDDDEEPAAHPPVQPHPAAARPRPAALPAVTNGETAPQQETAAGGRGESKGFDPYNSGVFNKSRAWERINRR